jgi:hypothetical protein
MAEIATRFAATVGLHGSASTWAFNVAREWLAAAGPPGDALAFYADRLAEIPPEAATGKRILLKSHHGSPELDDWLAARPTRLILTLRDPRDAALSMAQRFQAPLRDAVAWLRNDCVRLARLQERPHLMLRYENRFFEAPDTVAAVAAHLGVDASPEAARTIFARYRADAVRAFAQNLAALPPERLQTGGRFAMDRVTQIHAPHIGDGRSGKWKQLSPETRETLTAIFRPYLAVFGYPE